MFNFRNMMGIDNISEEQFEFIPCIIAHAYVENVAYCNSQLHGLSTYDNATIYVGAEQRMEGMLEIMKRFPTVRKENLIFSYILNDNV